jgi:hypothetical protein
MTDIWRQPGLSLVDALIATADPERWRRYCRLAAALPDGNAASETELAASAEASQCHRVPGAPSPTQIPAADQAAGRRRLARRGLPEVFAGALSPFGAAGAAAFDAFIARHRGPPALAAEIETLEQTLVAAFEAAGRAGRFCAAGFCGGAVRAVEPGWFGQIRLDFAADRIVLPDGSQIAGIRVTFDALGGGSGARERPARAMLREALERLWQRAAFTAGTGNERVLALVLQELQLSAADPPYGFKSAETIRKLRKALGMSL